MKTYHFFLFLSLLVVSCTKEKVDDVPDQMDDSTPVYPISIRAGQDTGVGIYHFDYSPDLAFNVNPTANMLADSIAVDLDNDATPDFILRYYHSSVYQLGSTDISFRIRPLANNQICVSPIDSTLADSLVFNDLIDSSLTWSSAKTLLYYYSSQSGSSLTNGYFKDNTDYYVGVKINTNGHVYYGWIYLNGNTIDKYSITTVYFDE